MISDLSPGDRLSLKGKLFELQKKLTILDLEQRLDNQYSYQPQIKPYELPNRPRNIIENSAKAEIIRQVRRRHNTRRAMHDKTVLMMFVRMINIAKEEAFARLHRRSGRGAMHLHTENIHERRQVPALGQSSGKTGPHTRRRDNGH
jgi:hypothetical protein